MNRICSRRNVVGSILVPLSLALFAGSMSFAKSANAQADAVFTSTNTAPNNSIIMYNRDHNGALTPIGTYLTGGAGTGSGLGSQGAVALSSSGNLLFVVNAGSSEISVFAVRHNGIRLLNHVPSGGSLPISLTTFGNWLYVLNAGTPNSITGFLFGENGKLTPIPGSTQSLSNVSTAPAQIGFDPDGQLLVVTEKGTQKIDVFPVNDWGMAGPAVVANSVGVTPFGFSFDHWGRLFVSEAQGGATNASTVSSYYVSTYGILPISGAVPTTQTAACWLAVSKDRKSVWTANAGSSNTISAFDVTRNGILSLRQGVAGSGLAGANDLALSEDGRFLYALENHGGSVQAYHVNEDKTLTLIGSFGNFGAGITGLAAY